VVAGFRGNRPRRGAAGELDAAAALVFAQALPGGMELGLDDFTSYAQWLRQRLGAESPRC
jgi:hypothetical protein